LINRAQIAEGTKYLAQKYNSQEKLDALYAATGLDHLSVDVSSTSVVATAPVTAGTVTMKKIYQYYKYDNTLYLLPMTGQQIKDILEYNAANRLKATVKNGSVSYSTTGDNFTNPVFYGLNFVYDMYQPAGSRVVISGFADGRAFDLTKTYIIAVNNYHLGNGPFAAYTTKNAIWSQTDDLGGGVVQDLMKEFISEQTTANGGVSPVKSSWSLTYSGDPGQVVEVNLTGDIYGAKTSAFKDGDQILIYYDDGETCLGLTGSNKIDSVTAKASGNMVAAKTGAAVFTVKAQGDYFYLIADGKYLTAGATGNSLSYSDAPSDYSLWYTAAADGGVHIMNANAAYNGNKNQALEWYSGFTTYGVKDTAAYLFNLYVVKECAVYSPNGIADGGMYLIYYDDGGTIVSSTGSGKLEATAVKKDSGLIPMSEELAVYTAKKAGDYYYLLAGGKYLTAGATGNSLSLAETPNDYSLWYLTAVDGGYNVMNANAAYNGNKNQALEWYSGFTTYGVGASAAYVFNFYTVKEAADPCANGHTWGEWTQTTAPTCTEAGVETRTCSVCGTTETRPVAALGHNWDAGKVTTEPTETTTGIITYTCTRCDATKTEELPLKECPSKKFTDVITTKWYHVYVDYVVEKGYLSGTTETTFSPDNVTTRGMLVTILYRIAGTPSVEGYANPFTDVKTGDYYEKAVKWAYKNEYVKGITETTFAPNAAVTREQMVMILYRYYNGQKVSKDMLSTFSDRDRVSEYAKEAMNWAVYHGIVSGIASGTGDTLLAPKGKATRAQFSTILYHLTNEA
jgi:hypothetical protein